MPNCRHVIVVHLHDQFGRTVIHLSYSKAKKKQQQKTKKDTNTKPKKESNKKTSKSKSKKQRQKKYNHGRVPTETKKTNEKYVPCSG